MPPPAPEQPKLTFCEHRLHSQIMFLQPIDQRHRELLVDVLSFSDEDQTKIFVDPAFDSVGAEAEVDVPHAAHRDVILEM